MCAPSRKHIEKIYYENCQARGSLQIFDYSRLLFFKQTIPRVDSHSHWAVSCIANFVFLEYLLLLPGHGHELKG